jgi:hypothetical protein
MSTPCFCTPVLTVSGSIASGDVAVPHGTHSTLRANSGRGNASIRVTATPEYLASSLFAPISESSVTLLVDH